ncbi:MAG: glycosyltransferase family 9 protein [Candidatus Omnitrophota bacterium]
MRKYLIVNPFGIGDVLFTTPVIRAIKESGPDTVVGYWCNERVKDILEDNPRLYKVFALSRGDLKKIYRKSVWQGIYRSINLLNGIKKEKFDTLLDFSLDHRYSLVAKLAGIKRRIGFNYKNRGRFLTDRIDVDGYSDKHAVEYYLELLGPAGIEPKNPNLELFVPDASKRKIGDILRAEGINDRDLIIGMAPGAGASWGKSASLKHWPAERFGQLAERLIADSGAKIIILGDGSERHIADEIINNMSQKPLDLTGKLSLRELSAAVGCLKILIANDGGPLHIAAALGRNTVSFFGPVDPVVYSPYPYDEKRHIVLRKGLECSPCYINFHLSDCLRNKECLQTIDVDSAFEAVAKLL